MRKSSMLGEEKFWNIVDGLVNMKTRTPLLNICEEHNISQSELNSFICFFKDLNTSFEVESVNGESFLIPPTQKSQVNISLNLEQWMKLQALFPIVSESCNEPFYRTIEETLGNIEDENEQYDLFNAVNNLEGLYLFKENLSSLEESASQSILKFIEQGIVYKRCIEIVAKNEQSYEIHPLKILNFDGELILVYEAINSKLIGHIEVTEVLKAMPGRKSDEKMNTKQDLNRYIKALRNIDDLEERIVLKVKNKVDFSSNTIKSDYLRNEVVFETKMGHSIWAASVELSDNIYTWLFEQGSSVEILGNQKLKDGYLNFCQLKLKKLA